MFSRLDRKNLRRLKALFGKNKVVILSNEETQLMRGLLDILEAYDVIRDMQVDGANMFYLTGSFEVFETISKDMDRENSKDKCSDRWHDFWMVVVGAFLGGVVTVLLYKII